MDSYIRLRSLGKGAFGETFHVRDKVTGLDYALKVCSISDPKIRAAAISEAEILKGISHQNVVKIFSFWEEAGQCCILLELCDGSFADLIENAKAKGFLFSEDYVIEIMQQLAEGLVSVHGSGVLHRDIKSPNILWTRGEDGAITVKIADFGISRHLRDGSAAHTFIGSPFSLSPEILDGQPYDQKSDVWSLGCVLYELCALSNPFGGLNPSLGSIVSSITACSYTPLHPSFSAPLQSLLASLFTLDPEKRPGSSAALAAFMNLGGSGKTVGHQTLSNVPWYPAPTTKVEATVEEAGWGTFSSETAFTSAASSSAAASSFSTLSMGGGVEPKHAANPSLYSTLPPPSSTAPQAPKQKLSLSAALLQTQKKFAK